VKIEGASGADRALAGWLGLDLFHVQRLGINQDAVAELQTLPGGKKQGLVEKNGGIEVARCLDVLTPGRNTLHVLVRSTSTGPPKPDDDVDL